MRTLPTGLLSRQWAASLRTYGESAARREASRRKNSEASIASSIAGHNPGLAARFALSTKTLSARTWFHERANPWSALRSFGASHESASWL